MDDPKKKYREKNREKIREKQREYYQRTKAERVAWQKEYKQTTQGKLAQRYAHIKHKYGLSKEDYLQLLEKQNNVCAICLNPETIENSILCVDHCHTTGKVRGLLCRMCNSALGKFGDNLSNLKRAVAYLEND